MAWPNAQPNIDSTNNIFRPFRSIKMNATNVAIIWNKAIQIDDNSGDKLVPAFSIVLEPYVKKINCPDKLVNSANIVAWIIA